MWQYEDDQAGSGNWRDCDAATTMALSAARAGSGAPRAQSRLPEGGRTPHHLLERRTREAHAGRRRCCFVARPPRSSSLHLLRGAADRLGVPLS